MIRYLVVVANQILSSHSQGGPHSANRAPLGSLRDALAETGWRCPANKLKTPLSLEINCKGVTKASDGVLICVCIFVLSKFTWVAICCNISSHVLCRAFNSYTKARRHRSDLKYTEVQGSMKGVAVDQWDEGEQNRRDNTIGECAVQLVDIPSLRGPRHTVALRR